MHLKLIEWILSGLVPPPKLVYRVVFAQGGPNVVVNTLGVHGPLWVGTSDAPGQNAQPPQGALQTLPSNGLQVSITRSPTGPNVTVHVGLSPVPPSLRRFTLVAMGQLQTLDPSALTDQWAPVLVARDGDKSTITSTTRIFGATHQVRGGGKVALGAAQASAAPARLDVDASTAYPDRTHRVFRLETDFDLRSGRGWSRLRTPGFNWPERSWSHPFIINLPQAPASPITAVGVGVGMVAGTGTPTATFNEFAIYAWHVPRPWWYPLISGLVQWYR